MTTFVSHLLGKTFFVASLFIDNDLHFHINIPSKRFFRSIRSFLVSCKVIDCYLSSDRMTRCKANG